MADVKVVKKGQFLFKAGEKIQSVILLQSGQVNICLVRNNKIFDIMTVGNGYVFGDMTVLGTATYLYCGLAQTECKYIELPVEAFKREYEAMNPTFKSFMKTMADRLKWAVNEVKNSKQDKFATPCAEDAIPRVFGSIFHVLNHKGLKNGSKAKADWMTLKNYSQRIFGESPKRIEQVTQILVKLKLGEYSLGRDPNNPDPEAPETDILGFEIYDLPALEAFFEFYQYYYYKGGKSELLKYDESNYNTLRLLLMAFKDCPADKYGVVSKEFNEVVDFFKEYGVALGAGHFTSLEGKGLFCKRKPAADGKVQLQFDYKEFRVQIDIWSLIREVDKLNEKGVVDMNEVDEGPKKKAMVENGVECTSCKTIVSLDSKFCNECGTKITAPAAAGKPGTVLNFDKKAA